jgi:class 3 adenylate cyclase
VRVVTCQACGHENPETNRFCGECAAPLIEPAPTSEVRKIVTSIFCDIVGSTAMGHALDPEKLRLVTRRYYDAMRAPIERHGGIVEKFIGDAVRAVFGVPQVHEDDALRAVRAAADMREVLAELNAELDRDHGVSLACRIGVNTGEVVAGSADAVIVGDAVNVAARLEQSATAGEILLGEETYRLVRDAVVAEPVDALDLKGKSDPVTAYRLIEVTPGAAGFTRHLDAPIVGRERELALLRDAFERTVTDHACQLFTVLGVAGVGKSRLVAAFVGEMSQRATILRGRCLPYGEGITFYPLAEALIEAAALSGTRQARRPRGRRRARRAGRRGGGPGDRDPRERGRPRGAVLGGPQAAGALGGVTALGIRDR